MPSSNASPIFATTRWTLVAAAGNGMSAESRRALAELCEAYWYPLYAFARRNGKLAEEAQDLTQSFFADLLEKDRLQTADQTRGRFRSFLLASFKHFIANRSREARALKRGGTQRVLALDFNRGEDQYLREPTHDMTAERIFDRRWATALLDNTVVKLQTEYSESNKRTLFDKLAPYLGGDRGIAYEQIANELNMSEGAVKVAVHRLRKRCRELLRAEIAQTVASPEDIDEELRTLFRAVEID